MIDIHKTWKDQENHLRLSDDRGKILSKEKETVAWESDQSIVSTEIFIGVLYVHVGSKWKNCLVGYMVTVTSAETLLKHLLFRQMHHKNNFVKGCQVEFFHTLISHTAQLVR